MKFLTDKEYVYRTAEQSRQPGYLKARFEEIRKQQANQQREKYVVQRHLA